MAKSSLKTYKKLCTEFYDLELEQQESSKKALDFYMNYALKANGPILEPMCGTGRFLIPMLQANLDIEGFDASKDMLSTLYKKYSEISNKKPPVKQLFLQNFSSEKQYNLIFVPFGSWGLITDINSSKSCLKKMYKHLAQNGKFILEIDTIKSFSLTSSRNQYGSNIRKDGSKITVNISNSYDSQTQVYSSLCNYKLIEKNIITETETEKFEQYLYQFDEMDQYLKETGFINIKKYINFEKEYPRNETSPILIYECSK